MKEAHRSLFTEDGNDLVVNLSQSLGILAGSLQISNPDVAANILKCRLKPVSTADYRVAFSKEERARLQRVFPDGVCDWTKKGDSQTPGVPWASFGPAPENLVFDVTRTGRPHGHDRD